MKVPKNDQSHIDAFDGNSSVSLATASKSRNKYNLSCPPKKTIGFNIKKDTYWALSLFVPVIRRISCAFDMKVPKNDDNIC